MNLPLNKETISIMNNFFEMNKKGQFIFSQKKQIEFLRKWQRQGQSLSINSTVNK